MKLSKIADKIMLFVAQRFLEDIEKNTDNHGVGILDIINNFSDYSEQQIFTAVRMLDSDNLVSVFYASDEPDNITINLSVIRAIEEDTLLKKGYSFLKELREWL